MPSTHPVTILIGVIGAVILVLITTIGLMCTAYQADPNEHKQLRMYQDWGKAVKIC